jgi:hypothetical protein
MLARRSDERLINALCRGLPVVLTSGPDAKEKQMVETIIAGCPNARLHSLAGQLTLRQLASVIDHARLFIGVDSVPMHMAAALGTPLVALFGPQAHLLASMAGERRGDLGGRFRSSRPGRHRYQHRRTLSRFNSHRRGYRGGEKVLA